MLLVVTLLFLFGVIYMDISSRRGWGLALLALALAGFGGYMTNFFVAMGRSPKGVDLAGGLIFSIYAAIFLALALMLLLVALVEAGSARHWWWLVGLLASALIPALVVLATVGLRLGAYVRGDFAFMEFLSVAFVPALTMLAYGIARIVRPVPLRAV